MAVITMPEAVAKTPAPRPWTSLVIIGLGLAFLVFLIALGCSFLLYRPTVNSSSVGPTTGPGFVTFVPPNFDLEDGWEIDYDAPYRLHIIIDPSVISDFEWGNYTIAPNVDLSVFKNLHVYLGGKSVIIRSSLPDKRFSAVPGNISFAFNFNDYPSGAGFLPPVDPVVVVFVRKLFGITNRSDRDVLITGFASPENLGISVAGAGEVVIPTLIAKSLIVRVTGTGSARITGSCNYLGAAILASGNLFAQSLNADFASVTVAGAGNAVISVRQSLSAVLSGSGYVYYVGTPQVFTSNLGTGQVEHIWYRTGFSTSLFPPVPSPNVAYGAGVQISASPQSDSPDPVEASPQYVPLPPLQNLLLPL